MKLLCVSLGLGALVAKIRRLNRRGACNHDAAPSPVDERKYTPTVCAAYRSPMPWGRLKKTRFCGILPS
jgi:hypothetical protein